MEGMSCFNGGGFNFKWGGGGRGAAPNVGHRFWWEGSFEKNRKMGGHPPLPTMGNPGKYTSYVLALPAPSVKTG